VHYQLAPCINTWLPEVAHLPKGEVYGEVARRIDHAIFKGYRLYPGNYVAADALSGTNRFQSYYTEAEKATFEKYVSSRMAMVDLEYKDETFLRECILKMYANPLLNQLSVGV
jgi:hypothetical protein